MQRGNGILLGVSSLPGKYGIGTMGKGARDFVDRLSECAQKYWQVLPISPTGYADSPYQSVSTFAGNPYFIDFEELYIEGLLSKEEFEECGVLFASDEGIADYALQFEYKEKILRKAFARGRILKAEEYRSFLDQNSGWLTDYALYMAVKASNSLRPFKQWPKDLAEGNIEALQATKENLKEDIEYHSFVQYLFFSQWFALKSYANEKGIKIIGDMPIYIAPDSADAWLNPGILDQNGDVAGCPPDYFSSTGQLWGNPVYNWEELKKQGYEWWIKRVRHIICLFDYVRIDHFRGFESYYSIPHDAQTAENGRWVKGPGLEFFDVLKNSLGELPFIAEDLGFLTQDVHDLLKATGYPGLKVLQFAFEPGVNSLYLPHQYDRNCIVYTGTHDNDTTAGWYKSLNTEQKAFIEDYVGDVNESNIHWKLIRLAMESVAYLCIIPMQDILGLPSEARMNTPQTPFGNWKWRMKPEDFDIKIQEILKKLTLTYAR